MDQLNTDKRQQWSQAQLNPTPGNLNVVAEQLLHHIELRRKWASTATPTKATLAQPFAPYFWVGSAADLAPQDLISAINDLPAEQQATYLYYHGLAVQPAHLTIAQMQKSSLIPKSRLYKLLEYAHKQLWRNWVNLVIPAHPHLVTDRLNGLAIMDAKIDTKRIKSLRWHLGVTTLPQLAAYTDQELLAVPNIGPGMVSNIQEALALYGLSLSPSG